MNLPLVALFVAAVFLVLKMGTKYPNPDPKACIQDTVLAFASCLLGLYAYDAYAPKELGPKPPSVFTERPNF